MPQKQQIPLSFKTKKDAILASLSTPESAYTDLSPKGSVDAAIKPLIDRINALEGVVTTSSCAGRLSIFLEGRKSCKGRERRVGVKDNEGFAKESEQAAVPGGKGLGGKWLFVSHEPVILPMKGENKGCLSQLLGLGSSEVQNEALAFSGDVNEMPLVRFQFEPMILHIMTASLHHAQPILSAAINAGFRESGVQSLKNLEDTNAFPMVAIRTAGLAFESLIGVILSRTLAENEGEEVEVHVTKIVSEAYLELLVIIANERFKINAERMRRFEHDLFKREEDLGDMWEDGKSRQERKRAEGLEQRRTLQKSQRNQERGSFFGLDVDEIMENAELFGSSLPP